MRTNNTFSRIALLLLLLLTGSGSLFAQTNLNDAVNQMMQIQQYERAIHIMAMLLIGFGFLMVFVRK